MKEALLKRVNERVQQMYQDSYDESDGLLWEELDEKNYHTAVEQGVIHRTRENLSWIPAVVCWNSEIGKEIACKTIPQVLALQDQNPESQTYGIWPYLFEEPLDKMKNPDWNWAAFLGGGLITIWNECRQFLPEKLLSDMKEALRCACESIVRRNMSVDYTNISLMSAFVLTVGGELLENEELREYGIELLEKQLDFVEKNGGYAEYNSPTYGMLDIEETGKILYYAKDKRALELAEKLHGLAWKVFAEHYHEPTGQIAPPHARCYEDLQNADIRTMITIGTQGRCYLEKEENWNVNLLWPFMELRCPEEYEKYFKPLAEPRVQEEEFYQGYDPIQNDEIRVLIEKGTPALKSYTYLHPDYCLGSFRWHDMWNQRRPLMAYIRTENGIARFRARCMHDDMDFAGAVMENIQFKNAAAGGISFVTDHGDYHYILTPLENGAMEAESLSIEFTVAGDVEGAAITSCGEDGYLFSVGECEIELHIFRACFGENKVWTEVIDTPEQKGVRLNLYQGARTKIDFHEIEKAYLLYGMEIRKKGEEKKSVCRISEENDIMITMETTEGDCGQVKVNPVPATFLSENKNLEKRFKNGGFYYETLLEDRH